jgi:hypothetical protein
MVKLAVDMPKIMLRPLEKPFETNDGPAALLIWQELIHGSLK